MKSFKNFLNEDTGFPTGPVGEIQTTWMEKLQIL